MSLQAAAAAAPPHRQIVAVVGDNCLVAAAMEPGMAGGDEQHKQQLAEQVGRAIVDGQVRQQQQQQQRRQHTAEQQMQYLLLPLMITASSVMDAAMKGARSSSRYSEGDTIAVLPGEDPAAASSHADIVICTGFGSYRNGVMGRADAVIAVGGGAGTLQEICTAWKARRPVVVMAGASGATSALAGKCIDGRGGPGRRAVLGAEMAEQAVQLLQL
uniref:LSDAT prokaryote domain-containing protein n=1 Tax=Tetradesmus obliquus TaxID=3088 RepID=A0A383W1U2_TETOB|eukprot:jgi/Sobl393_1/5208/SZX71093.1